MNKIIGRFWVLFFLFMFTSTALAGTKPPAEGDLLPEIVLTVPQNSDQQKYLGLSGETTFTIPRIKARVVIVEIFSMYCPYCQAEAPALNKLYEKIENDGSLKDRFKLIGIGAGNTTFEVEHFRNSYNIPFPLFPDDDFSIHKKIGDVRTPYFFAVGINKDGTHRILYSHAGRLKNHNHFIDTLRQRAGLN
jgi:thiol-disulfide isomerase/thioredoxin